MEYREVQRTPVYVQVAEQLRESILDGSLPAGAALPSERELGERFGVGRTTVREALRSLQSQGLAVQTAPTAPLQVIAPEALSTDAFRDTLVHLMRLGRIPLSDLVGLRRALEGSAAADAARRRPRPNFTAARDQITMMRVSAGDVVAFEQADVRFHVELVRASGNEAMTLVMLAVRDSSAAHLLSALQALEDPRPTLRRLIREHEKIFDAVARGDADAARALSEAHITNFYGKALKT